MDSQAERTWGKAAAGEVRWVRRWLMEQEVTHFRADKLGRTTGEQD